jgi:hypothetical protein
MAANAVTSSIGVASVRVADLVMDFWTKSPIQVFPLVLDAP